MQNRDAKTTAIPVRVDRAKLCEALELDPGEITNLIVDLEGREGARITYTGTRRLTDDQLATALFAAGRDTRAPRPGELSPDLT